MSRLTMHFSETIVNLFFYGELEGVDNAKLLNDTHDRIGELEAEIVESYTVKGIDFNREWNAMLTENQDADDTQLNEAVNATMADVPSSQTVKSCVCRETLAMSLEEEVL